MLPEIIPGVAGIFVIVTASDCGEDVPQVLLAVTVTFPPEEPAVALIEFVADDPDQPAGRVQL